MKTWSFRQYNILYDFHPPDKFSGMYPYSENIVRIKNPEYVWSELGPDGFNIILTLPKSREALSLDIKKW
jgi:hypothetical protein